MLLIFVLAHYSQQFALLHIVAVPASSFSKRYLNISHCRAICSGMIAWDELNALHDTQRWVLCWNCDFTYDSQKS